MHESLTKYYVRDQGATNIWFCKFKKGASSVYSSTSPVSLATTNRRFQVGSLPDNFDSDKVISNESSYRLRMESFLVDFMTNSVLLILIVNRFQREFSWADFRISWMFIMMIVRLFPVESPLNSCDSNTVISAFSLHRLMKGLFWVYFQTTQMSVMMTTRLFLEESVINYFDLDKVVSNWAFYRWMMGWWWVYFWTSSKILMTTKS